MNSTLKVSEAAKRLDVSARTLRREIADGKLRVSKAGGRDKVFDGFSYIACDEKELFELERRAILKYRPKLNKL